MLERLQISHDRIIEIGKLLNKRIPNDFDFYSNALNDVVNEISIMLDIVNPYEMILIEMTVVEARIQWSALNRLN